MDTFTNLETQILLFGVVLSSVLVAKASQHMCLCYDNTLKFVISKSIYLISFLIPWFCISFTDSGSDYYNYYEMIDRLTWDNYYMFFSEEPGWNVFTLSLRTILNGNTHLTIFAIKSLTLGIIYYIIYSYGKEFRITLSLISYLLLNYISSFYLISIAFSVAISTIAVSLLYRYNYKYIGVGLIILAGMLHNSAFIFLPIYIALIVYRSNTSRTKKYIFTIAFLSAGVLASSIYNLAMSNIEAFHYGNYGSSDFRGSGAFIVIIYVPLFFLIKKLSVYLEDRQLFNFIYIFALADCMFNVLSYQFIVIERMQFYTLPLYMIFFPTAVQSIRKSHVKNSIRVAKSIQTLMFLFILFRGGQEFLNRTTSLNAVAFYHFLNPFSL